MYAIMFLLPFLFAAGPDTDADARAALALAQAAKPAPAPKPAPTYPSYVAGSASAAAQNLPLITFVGRQPPPFREWTGLVTCCADSLPEYPAECVVVSRDGFWVATLPYHADEVAIRSALLPKAVQPAADPFGPASQRALRRGERRQAADADTEPQLRLLLAGMEQYAPARNTQTTFRRQIGVINPSPRNQLEDKWNVPGHLAGIEGWSSALYRKKDVKAAEFLVRQDPFDSVSAVTWGRSYPDTHFVDVLRNTDGKLFEVRVAEKQGVEWERYVAFADSSARPAGYIRPKRSQCVECHAQAGVSAYGGAAVPGGDTVLSDPVEVLESGRSVQGGFGTRLP